VSFRRRRCILKQLELELAQLAPQIVGSRGVDAAFRPLRDALPVQRCERHLVSGAEPKQHFTECAQRGHRKVDGPRRSGDEEQERPGHLRTSSIRRGSCSEERFEQSRESPDLLAFVALVIAALELYTPADRQEYVLG
jgi:hypothetical protein